MLGRLKLLFSDKARLKKLLQEDLRIAPTTGFSFDDLDEPTKLLYAKQAHDIISTEVFGRLLDGILHQQKEDTFLNAKTPSQIENGKLCIYATECIKATFVGLAKQHLTRYDEQDTFNPYEVV